MCDDFTNSIMRASAKNSQAVKQSWKNIYQHWEGWRPHLYRKWLEVYLTFPLAKCPCNYVAQGWCSHCGCSRPHALRGPRLKKALAPVMGGPQLWSNGFPGMLWSMLRCRQSTFRKARPSTPRGQGNEALAPGLDGSSDSSWSKDLPGCRGRPLPSGRD